MRLASARGGAIFSTVTGLVYYGFWTFLAFGAVLFFAAPANQPYFLPVLSGGLLFVMLYWQLAPVISAGFGASLDLQKLLVYPIPHRKLFTVEVLLRLTNCGEMLILLGGVAIGLLRNPLYGWRAAPFIVFATLIFAGTNLLLSAGARHLMERLFRRTRMKEAMMLLLAVAGLLPQILFYMDIRRATLFRLAPAHIFWPWAAVARLMLGAQAVSAAALALLWLGIAYRFGRWQFERGLRYDGPARAAGRRGVHPGSIAERIFRAPARFLHDPVAAIVEKELRTFSRIPRFRMIYLMSCVFGIVIYLPALRNPNPESFGMQSALPIMALYGLLMLGPITYWNAFGFDRSAVQGYFSWPIPFRDALIGKNITVALLILPQMALVTIVGKTAHLPSSPAKCLETAAVVLIASLYWFAVGNICSVRMARPMDPDKMNQMANKLQALSVFSAPLLLLPIALAYWARSVFQNEFVFSGILLIAAVVGGIFYKVGLDTAVADAHRRRESLLLHLSRSEGPISIG